MNDKIGKRLKIESLLMDVRHQLIEAEEALISLWEEEDASEDTETSPIFSSRVGQEEGREEDEDWPPRE